MKNLRAHLSQIRYQESSREVMYALLVRREAIKASHSRLFKKLKVTLTH